MPRKIFSETAVRNKVYLRLDEHEARAIEESGLKPGDWFDKAVREHIRKTEFIRCGLCFGKLADRERFAACFEAMQAEKFYRFPAIAFDILPLSYISDYDFSDSGWLCPVCRKLAGEFDQWVEVRPESRFWPVQAVTLLPGKQEAVDVDCPYDIGILYAHRLVCKACGQQITLVERSKEDRWRKLLTWKRHMEIARNHGRTKTA